MTNAEFLQSEVEWANKWLAMPADQLPGTLTHDRCLTVRETALDSLLDHARFSVTPTGLQFSHYAARP